MNSGYCIILYWEWMKHRASHALIYFRESEDTVLLIMKEIYAAYGIEPQRQGQPVKPTLYSPAANTSNKSPSQPPLPGFRYTTPPPPAISAHPPTQQFRSPDVYPGPAQPATLPCMSYSGLHHPQ